MPIPAGGPRPERLRASRRYELQEALSVDQRDGDDSGRPIRSDDPGQPRHRAAAAGHPAVWITFLVRSRSPLRECVGDFYVAVAGATRGARQSTGPPTDSADSCTGGIAGVHTTRSRPVERVVDGRGRLCVVRWECNPPGQRGVFSASDRNEHGGTMYDARKAAVGLAAVLLAGCAATQAAQQPTAQSPTPSPTPTSAPTSAPAPAPARLPARRGAG